MVSHLYAFDKARSSHNENLLCLNLLIFELEGEEYYPLQPSRVKYSHIIKAILACTATNHYKLIFSLSCRNTALECHY